MLKFVEQRLKNEERVKMGKTYKDRANHALHHGYEPNGDKEQELADILDRNPHKGLRHGNNRKSEAKSKKIERRKLRRQKENYNHD